MLFIFSSLTEHMDLKAIHPKMSYSYLHKRFMRLANCTQKSLVVYFWWVGVGKSTSYSTAFRYACCIFLVGGSGKVLVTAQLSATLVVVYFWWLGVGKCASYSTAFSYTKSYRTSLCSCHWFLGKEKRGYTKEKYQKGGYGCTIWDVGEWG